jgi:hypothetical protein
MFDDEARWKEFEDDLLLDQQIQCNVNFLWPHFVNEFSGLDTISQHFDAHVVVNSNFQLSCFVAK